MMIILSIINYEMKPMYLSNGIYSYLINPIHYLTDSARRSIDRRGHALVFYMSYYESNVGSFCYLCYFEFFPMT